ncbi:MAG TPA: hypothetical protein DD990_26865, partial [Cyanobacteria bacterium UBA11368]|nr:hypothetical protein [Cyanobacteria bacterium UBA11368]
ATGADLVLANNAKLIGSAQLYRGNTVLQHGSMRLYPNLDLFERVFGEAEISKIDLPLPKRQDRLIPTVIDALTATASRCFDVQLKVQPLSADEWQAIEAQPILELGLAHQRP